MFDKVIVLYEGSEIFFGTIEEAKTYFTDLGFVCPDRCTTPDFLTSVTDPKARLASPGYDRKLPRTAADFENAWAKSLDKANLAEDIAHYENQHPMNDNSLLLFRKSQRAQKARLT